MITATGTRAEARKHLAGKWGKGALMVLCYFIVEFVLELIGNGLSKNAALYSAYQIIVFIISVPISYGFIISFIKLKRGETVEAFSFLQLGFSSFSRSWSVAWHTFLKMIVPFIIFFLSLILLAIFITINTSSNILSKTTDARNKLADTEMVENAQLDYLNAKNNYSLNPTSSNYQALQRAQNELDSAKSRRANSSYTNTSTKKSNEGFSGVLITIIAIGYIALMFYVAVKSLSLALSPFIAYDNETLSGKEACNLSQQIMKGNKGNLFVLSLSFIGWAILAIFTLGIGYLWLTAYINVSMVCFYEEVSNKNLNGNIENNTQEILN